MMTTRNECATGRRHMIAAGHELAARAGMAVLEAGGNAIDAGVAAGVTLAVVAADEVSFGGIAPIILYSAEEDRVVSIAGVGTWPLALPPDHFRRKHAGQIPLGVERTVVPAAPDAWITALARWGTMSFGDVSGTAIGLARSGFTVSRQMARVVGAQREAIASFPANAALYLQRGRPVQEGDRLVLPELAAAIQYMADEERADRHLGRAAGLEAARRAFYRGDIATLILRHQAQNGGFLEAGDLADFRSEVEASLCTRFGQTLVHTGGPWSQGPALLQMLGLLDAAELVALGHNTPACIHVMAEAVKLAFADREAHFGDPHFVPVPMEGLLTRSYAATRRALIRHDRALRDLPPGGDPLCRAHAASPIVHRLGHDPAEQGSLGDTSAVAVVDGAGNAFAATPSDPCYYGPIVPGLGFVVSARGGQSWADPSHPSGVAPGKRPRASCAPALAMRPGRMLMPISSPGGDVQLQAVLQAFLNSEVFGMNPQAAVEAPRFGSYAFPATLEPHLAFPGLLNLERRLGRATGAALAGLGHKIRWWPEWEMLAGAVCTVVADQARGVLSGGADPRRECVALGA